MDGGAPPIDLTWRKNFALLLYLARSPGRSRSRDHLIGLFWADKPEHDARRSLNVALSTLRQHLGKDSLVTDVNRVRLVSGVVELDVDRFERLADAGELASAVALVGGEFLAGFGVPDAVEFETWLAAERAAVRRRALDVLTRRANELLDQGRLTHAEPLAAQALSLDPFFEPAVRCAMRARVLAGDGVRALSAYEAFKAALGRDLGTAPDRETEALAERVRRERTRPLSVTPTEKVVTGPRIPLEGRGDELTRVVAAWRACREERRRSLVMIEGDGGMGKTRLGEELTARARVDGAAVATIRSVDGDLAAPWSGVLALSESGLLTAPGAAGAAPAALAAFRMKTSPPPHLGRPLSEVVTAVCEERPLMLVLEDAHWLDRESLLAVLATLRDPRAPLAVVTTSLPQPPRAELEEVRARLGREVAGTTIRLGPLSEKAIAELARWALPQESDDQLARVTRRVAHDSARIPLFAVALLQAVADGLDLGDPRPGWPVPGRTLEQTLPGDLPDSIVGAVRVMFGRTSPDAQEVLRVAAVLGRRVTSAVLRRGAIGLDGDRVTRALDELEWRHWLTAETRGYGFVARIFRDVVDRDMVTNGQRQRILAAMAR